MSMTADFLNEPLGLRPAPARGAVSLRVMLAALVAAAICSAGLMVWHSLGAAAPTKGVIAVIKPAEAPPPPAKQAAAPAVAPEQSVIPVFRPPGATGSTGVFIKVPQDKAK